MKESFQDLFKSIKSSRIKERLEALVQELGEPHKVQGDEWIWACPHCKEIGADTDGNHFKYNIQKDKYDCFASKDHTHAISERIKELLNKNKKKKSKDDWQLKTIEPIHIPEDEKDAWSLEKKIKDPEKIIKNHDLQWCENNKAILSKHGERYKLMPLDGRSYKWDNNTGVKIKPGFIEITSYKGQKSLLLLEGLNNLFALASLTSDEFNQEFYTVTSVHGVTSTLNLEKEIDFNKFENIIVYLDKDGAGNAEAKRIKEKYPNAHII